MIKTLLETTLEKTLLELKMPLGERRYAEDLDAMAELDDASLPINTSHFKKASLAEKLFLIDHDASAEQLFHGCQPFLQRFSCIYRGFGVRYSIDAGDAFGEGGLSARNSSDNVIGGRKFGKNGGEVLSIVYDEEGKWKMIKERDFYGKPKDRFSICVHEGYDVSIENWAKEDNFEECEEIRGVIERMNDEFMDTPLFKQVQAEKVADYLREIKQVADS